MILETWGATPAEVAGAVVGDELLPDARVTATRCITIAAAADDVFPWLRQMGFGRAGWYSYDWIDNLGRRSARSINPEWQNVQSGDVVPGGPVGFEAVIVDAPRALFCVLRVRAAWRSALGSHWPTSYVTATKAHDWSPACALD